jgi:hypothetical protein
MGVAVQMKTNTEKRGIGSPTDCFIPIADNRGIGRIVVIPSQQGLHFEKRGRQMFVLSTDTLAKVVEWARSWGYE